MPHLNLFVGKNFTPTLNWTFIMHAALIHVVSLAMVVGPTLADQPAVDLTLDSGYRQMYNLEFARAHDTFANWKRLHPEDPLGPTSDAAAYLFAELDRLGVLQSELFVSDSAFLKHQNGTADPQAKRGFEAALAASDVLAKSALSRNPHDKNALFAQVLNFGLRGDYLALIEHRYLAALSYLKEGSALADKLLAIDPSYYDAYLAVGAENYILSLNSAPVRWLLRLYGAQTDRSLGIQKLQLTADKGRYLAPYARLLLAVAALRDKNRTRARELLTGLVQEFPNNRLYARELARLE